ncbi:helix-turn-helix transcriptional regulator [Bacillus sp. AFS073361]|uniref:helix-turn-helix domain-containing protein n=1 Tax=Bacillus sp. AFS073361 TaxID=2033511 RepID=UPI00211D431B|nr:helix-turn-helix transcriptional regulator [Bacillus sp. AFS073361]
MGTKYVLRSHLKEVMEKDFRGISANKLAATIGERRSTLNDLINNKDMETRHIPARLIAKLCVWFKITPSDLFSVIVINEDEEGEGKVVERLSNKY